MLKDELRQLLRELAAATGAVSVAIAHPDHPELSELPGFSSVPARRGGSGRAGRNPGGLSPAGLNPAGVSDPELDASADLRSHATHSMSVPVGGGAVLRAGFLHAEDPPDPNGRAAALERAARALRACARRWDVGTLPPLAFPESSRSPRGLILSRVRSYLGALVGSLGMDNAVVTLRGRVLASARPLGELHRAQIPFTVRRVAVEADRRRGGGPGGPSSHGELVGEDFYALGFWYGGCLLGFFSRPYAADFVRHRARLVTRELSHLLSLLDEPSHDPAQTAPRPD
ncbi:MAG TPA: hypothetical protein VKB80_32215 [Kofleriaceae bacterium]|nr:hypothetical protein [Kofleriaceae bacterium]